jgi:putative flavoprotein involved in K+ transport
VPHTTTVIIGAGHCGLAMSRCLAARSVDHVVLERGEVANSWRTQRWDSLRLLTPNWMTRLPGYAYRGADPDGYLGARQVTALLEDYAECIRGADSDRRDGHLGAGRRRWVRGAD